MALMRRLLALLVLLGLVVAAPIALWLLGRDLLPSSVPTVTQAWDALITQDTGQLFMGVLVVIGFVAWAVFAFSVLVEFAAAVAGLRGGGTRAARLRRRMLRIPLVGSAQGAAAALPGGAGGVIRAPEGYLAPDTARAGQVPVHGDVAGDDDVGFRHGGLRGKLSVFSRQWSVKRAVSSQLSARRKKMGFGICKDYSSF